MHIVKIENLEDYICQPDISIREVMARITGKISLFQLVVGENGKLVGSVTDGDIRRSILRGVMLDDPVRECMNGNPIVGTAADEDDNTQKLEIIRNISGDHATFLPIVDGYGILDSIRVYEHRTEQAPYALIMAGGLGSRLGERTKKTPKPLLHIGDKPMLEHIIERLEHAGVADMYISACYLAEQIESFAAQRDGRANIKIVREETPLGTAGAIGLLPKKLNEPLLVLNGDVLTAVDYGALFAFHERHEYDATIAVAQHRVQIPFGVVRHGEDGLFKGIDEKPNQEHFIAAGIYMLSPEFRALIAPKEHIDMPALLNKARALGFKIGLFPIHEYWADIGSPDDFDLANNNHAD